MNQLPLPAAPPTREGEVVGFVIWLDGLEPLCNAGTPKVFATYGEALAARERHPLGLVSTISPITATRLAEITARGGR